jgi:hypothetical protein
LFKIKGDVFELEKTILILPQIMKFFSIIGNSFGCSASGERLVSAARDGDIQEAKALLEYNPRLARYSTFGVRNSPLHYSAAQGHHEVFSSYIFYIVQLFESCGDGDFTCF